MTQESRKELGARAVARMHTLLVSIAARPHHRIPGHCAGCGHPSAEVLCSKCHDKVYHQAKEDK